MDVTESSYLPEAKLAQQAELIALIGACQLAKAQVGNVYTNSGYAFRVAHYFGMLWKEKGISYFFRPTHKKWAALLRIIRLYAITQTIGHYQNTWTFQI